MNKKFNPKEFLNIKILDTSENQTIRGGADQKQKQKQKVKQKQKNSLSHSICFNSFSKL